MLLIVSVKSGFNNIKSKVYDINLIVVKPTLPDREDKFADKPHKKVSVPYDTLPEDQYDKYTPKDAKILSAKEKTGKLNNKADSVEEIKGSPIVETKNNVGKGVLGIISDEANGGNVISQNVTSGVTGEGAGTYEGTNSGGGSYSSYNTNQADFDRKKYLLFLVNYVKEHIPYPYLARKRGIEGDLKVGVVIEKNGKVNKVKIVRSSGYQILDDNTIKYFTELVLPKKPDEATSYEIEVSYRLR
jgi:TonB family protein